MRYLKIISISILYIIISILILTFIMTLFSYINFINEKATTIFKIIIPTLSLFIGGFYIGRNSNKKGWLEGLKLGVIFIILLIIFKCIINISFEAKNILYYAILIISSIFGSMIGISTKKNR